MSAETKLLYQASEFPVFQNRMYDTKAEAQSCLRGQFTIVEDLTAGLVSNASSEPDLLVYDAAYQNEQANSAPFRTHLGWVAGAGAGKLLPTLSKDTRILVMNPNKTKEIKAMSDNVFTYVEVGA